MAALFNLARMTVSSSGTGDITLNSAVSGYLTFDLAGCSTAAAGQSLAYAINDITASEIGTATYYSSALALRARTPNRSTNGNAVIAMSNAAQVFITPRAEDFYPITSGSTQFSNASVIFASSLGQFTQDTANFTYSSSIARLGIGGGIVASSGIAGNSVTASSAVSIGYNLGVGGVAAISGQIVTTSTAISTTPASGALVAAGGAGIGGQLSVSGDQLWTTAGWTRSIASQGAIRVGSAGFFGMGSDANILYTWKAASDAVGSAISYITQQSTSGVTIISTTASATPATGALIVSGGVGVAGGVNAATTSTFTRNAAPFGAAVATIQVAYEGGILAEGITFRPQSDNSFATLFYNAAGGSVGNINTSATDTFYNTASDGRLKTDPQPFDGAALIAALKPYDFAWKSNGIRGHGVFAEEAMTVYPGAVTYDQKSDVYGVDYSKFVPLLIRALQQANDRIAALEAKGKP